MRRRKPTTDELLYIVLGALDEFAQEMRSLSALIRRGVPTVAVLPVKVSVRSRVEPTRAGKEGRKPLAT